MSKEEENQFGLVYDGAITENEIGKVNIHSNKLKRILCKIFIIIRKRGKMKKLKIIIDILLFIITIALFNIGLIGNLMHEILGIALAILIIIHILLNFKWIKQVTKNFKKTNTKTKIMYIIDILIMIIYLRAIICGILIANEVFNFHMSSSLGLVLTHLILGRLAIITMFIHLGLHLDRIFKKK